MCVWAKFCLSLYGINRIPLKGEMLYEYRSNEAIFTRLE